MLLPAVPGILSKQHAVSSISQQERIIFHPLVLVGNISLKKKKKNTPEFSSSYGIAHFRQTPLSNNYLLHSGKFLFFLSFFLSPSPSPSSSLSFSPFFFFFQYRTQFRKPTSISQDKKAAFQTVRLLFFHYHHSLN